MMIKILKKLLGYVIPAVVIATLAVPFATSPIPVSASVLVFYSNADPETTSVDGQTRHLHIGPGVNWATMHDDPNGDATLPSGTVAGVGLRRDAGGSDWYYLTRAHLGFDTSSLPDDATISGVTLKIYNYYSQMSGSYSPSWAVVSSNPTSNTDLVIADFDKTRWGTTLYSNNVSYAATANDTWVTFNFTAAGIAAMNLSGVSNFGIRDAGSDIPNIEQTAVGPLTFTGIFFWTVDSADPLLWPRLTVTYTTPAGGGSTPLSVTTNDVQNTSYTTATGNFTVLGSDNITEYGMQISENAFADTNLAWPRPADPGNNVQYTGWLAKVGDDKYIDFYRKGPGHAGGGYPAGIYARSYVPSTQTWSAEWSVYPGYLDSIDPRNLSGAVIGTRILIAFYRSGQGWGGGDSAYIWSTDLTGTSWSTPVKLNTSMAVGADHGDVSPHGEIIACNTTGHYLMPLYSVLDVTAVNWTWVQFLMKSTDSGVTWTQMPNNVYSGLTSRSEFVIAYIGSNKLVGVSRSESGGPIVQTTSADNGDNWTAYSNTNLGVGSAAEIPHMIYDSTSSNLRLSYFSGDTYWHYTVESPAATVYASATSWNQPIPVPGSYGQRGGYWGVVKTSNTKYFSVHYVSDTPTMNAYGEVWQYIQPKHYMTAGNSVTGNFTVNFTNLTEGRTYYVVAGAYNIGEGWQWGLTKSFTTLSTSSPAVATISSGVITTTTVTLTGEVTSMGTYTPVYGTFQYKRSVDPSWSLSSETTAIIAIGTYNLPVTGLTPNTNYTYRARLRYSGSSEVFGNPDVFSTLSIPVTPGSPVNLSAQSTTTEINLTWTLGTGATETYIRYSTDTYPTTLYSGALLYQGSGSSTSHSGLTSGLTYYYSAWSLTGSTYSTTYATASGKLGTPSTPGGLDNPTTFIIGDAKIYNNYIEGGDKLIVLSYKILYPEEPVQDIKDYYIVQVWDGTILKAQGTPLMWGFRPTSIYLSAGNNLDPSRDYIVKLVGRSSKWTVAPETTYSLNSGSWSSSLTNLDAWIIMTAKNMGRYDSVDYVDTVSGYREQLNSTGGQIFETAIPALRKQRPDLFSSSAGTIPNDTTPRSETLTTNMTATEKLGSGLVNGVESLAVSVGMDPGSGSTMLGIVSWAIALLVAGVIAVATGEIGFALMATSAIVLGEGMLGFFSLSDFAAMIILVFVAGVLLTITTKVGNWR